MAPFVVLRNTHLIQRVRTQAPGDEEFTGITLNGRATMNASCAVGDVSIDVPILAEIPLAGLGGLSNITVVSFYLEDKDLAGGDDSDSFFNAGASPPGTLITANISVWNPSVATMELGDVSFDMVDAVSGQRLGSAASSAFRLRPGANLLTLEGLLLPVQTDQGLAAASAFFSNFLAHEAQPLSVKGTGVSGEYASLAWLQSTVKQVETTVEFPGSSRDSQTIQALEIKSMGVDFTQGSTVLLTTRIAATVSLPWPKVTVRNISSVSMDLAIRWRGATVATFSTPAMPLQSFDVPSQRLILDTPSLELTIKDKQAFNGFLNETLMATALTVNIEGTVSTVCSTAMGDLTLKEIPLANSVTIDGFGGLGGDAIQLNAIDVVSTSGSGAASPMQDSDFFVANADSTITNPGTTTAALGTTKLQVHYDGVYIGVLTVDNFSLQTGKNHFPNASLLWQPALADRPKATELLARYLTYASTSQPTAVQLSGFAGSTSNPLLLPSLSAFTTTTFMTGIDFYLVSKSAVHVIRSIGDIHKPHMDVFMYNPFNCEFRFHQDFNDRVLIDSALSREGQLWYTSLRMNAFICKESSCSSFYPFSRGHTDNGVFTLDDLSVASGSQVRIGPRATTDAKQCVSCRAELS